MKHTEGPGGSKINGTYKILKKKKERGGQNKGTTNDSEWQAAKFTEDRKDKIGKRVFVLFLEHPEFS